MNPLPLYLPGEMRTADTPTPPVPAPDATWAEWWPVLVSGALVLVVAVLAAVLIRRLWRKAFGRSAREGQDPTDTPPVSPVTSTDANEDGPGEAAPSRSRRSAQERADMIRTTAAPLVLGGVVLWLVFDGLEAFARDSMGLVPPMSYAVIIAFEFVALWLCWERFARAQEARPDVPGLMVGQWALLILAMLFQYDHAQHDELTLMGTVARVALPAILGGVVEWALHSRRTTVRNRDDQDRGRLFDHSLRSNPVLFVRSRYVLAAHADWTAEDAVQHVRTQDAKTLALRLRDLINHPPASPVAPAEVAEPAPPFVPAGAGERERDRVQRNYERAQERAETTRARRARDHERALSRYRRALRRHEREVARLRDRLVSALDALGFTGSPTDTPAADMLRAVQVGVLVDDMVTLDYSRPDEAVRWFGGLITGGDLEAARVDRRALQDAAPSTRSGSPTGGVDEADTDEAAPAASGVDVHSEPTPSPTPAPAGGVDTAPNGVGEDVDTGASNTLLAGVAGTVPPAGVHTEPAPSVDGANQTPDPTPNGAGVHTDTGWRSPGTHTDAPADEVDEADAGVDEGPLWPAPAPAPAPVVNTDGDDEGPDDDGDGPRGGGAPAPVPAGVLPGQTTVEDALAQVAAPSALDVARVALDAPTWDEATTKKEQVTALLWEHYGNVTAVRSAYADRTGTEVPRDLYRAGPRGYAYRWHYDVTAYLISEYAHVDTVRAVLAEAGVETEYEAVTAALDEWESTHSHQVLQFRRVPSGP